MEIRELVTAMLLMFIGGFVLPRKINGQEISAPTPAPAPMSDGIAIDQGVAYILMFVALLLTYLIH
eukprot:Gb_06646 [translate_table: standard]